MSLSQTAINRPTHDRESSTPAAPAQALLGTLDFWVEQLTTWKNLFDAAEEFDDWDGARETFEALIQDAWALLIVSGTDAPLRCPVLDQAVYHD